MLPNRLRDFIESMVDKIAAQKLHDKICILEVASGHDCSKPYVTKIAYYVDDDDSTGRSVARILFTNLQGEESFKMMSGNIAEFVSEEHRKESGEKIDVFGIVLSDYLTQHEQDMLERYNQWCLKKIAKDKAKGAVVHKWAIGDILALKSKIRDGSRKTYKKFIVKKVIWSVNANPVNVLILKQIEGPMNNLTLTKADCKKYHIRYEEGLQVYSMMMNFNKIGKEKPKQ